MKKGKSKVLIGLQYGDEGKGRVLDKILGDEHFDIIARFNGGANAGHSLEINGQKIALHQIPSGIFYPDTKLYIGSGCVINSEKLNQEKQDVINLGINLENRLYISGNSSLIQPHHLLLDRLFGNGVGTTMNGIGPTYSDQGIRAEGDRIKNIKLGEYLANREFILHVKENLFETVSRYRDLIEKRIEELEKSNLTKESIELRKYLDNSKLMEIVDRFETETRKLENHLSTDPLFLQNLIETGKNIFFEGAQSTMLDSITGSVPYVTSSRTLAAAAYTGGDLSMKNHDKTLAVCKAIMSRVGNGPFISEYGGEESEIYCADGNGKTYVKEVELAKYDPYKLLRSENMFEIGIGLRILEGEYGASTKRPRRVGILDLVMLKQNCKLNGVDELYINKIDSLRRFKDSSLQGIPFVTSYELDSKTIDYVPSTIAESKRTKPVITYLPFFHEDISGIRDVSCLPRRVRDILEFIEEKVETPIHGIGVGPEREQFVRIR